MNRQIGLPFPLPGSRDAAARRRDELDRRASAALARARAILGVATDDLHDASTLLTAHLRAAAPGATDVAAVAALVVELQDLVAELAEHGIASRLQRIAGCEQALARLRTLPSTEALLERACDELVRYGGFGRALLSRVQDGVWRPWKLSEADSTVDWFGEWSDAAIPLDTLTRETRLLTERRPELVLDTSGPGIHRIVRTGVSNSYVVAPIVPEGNVIGFLHADHHPTSRRCDEGDRDVLWAFAEGFGHLFTRFALLDRLTIQRDRVRSTLAAVERRMTQLTESEIELASFAEAGATISRGSFSVLQSMSAVLEELTPREREVLELMVSGATNQAIADGLHVTVGTVKSHVKHILAKLGAVNRSQVIARFHGVAFDWRG